MTLELIVFIASILFGALLYWRESHGNGLYRFFNKVFNAKKLQMKPEDKKGFVYQQSLFFRIVFITIFFLIGIVITRFLIPIDLATVSIFASMIVGTVAGTYLANIVFSSGKVVEEHSGALDETIGDVIDKSKDFIEEVITNEPKVVEEAKKEIVDDTPKENEKSARERLKDKGLL